MVNKLTKRVDENEVYEYIYTRKRFNSDLIWYSIIIVCMMVFRATSYIIYGVDGFRGTSADLLSLMIFSGVLGVAVKSIITLRRSRAIGTVNSSTGEINVVETEEEPPNSF